MIEFIRFLVKKLFNSSFNWLKYCYINNNGFCILANLKNILKKLKKEIDKAVQRFNQVLSQLNIGGFIWANKNTVKLIDGNSFIDNLEKRLILKKGKEEHEHLKSEYKKIKFVSIISMIKKSKYSSSKEIGPN